jgi:hypothetical protein
MAKKYTPFTFRNTTFRLFVDMVGHNIIEDVTGTERMLFFNETSFGSTIYIEEEYCRTIFYRLQSYSSLIDKPADLKAKANELLDHLTDRSVLNGLGKFVELPNDFREMCVPYCIKFIY